MRKAQVIAAFLSLGLLTGCAVNQGSALAAEFSEHWSGAPDVADVKTIGQNPLPFSGSASGELVLAEGTGVDRMAELVDELRRYVVANDKVTGRVTADGITFTVVEDEKRNSETLTLWQTLAADDRVVDGDLAEASGNGVIRRSMTITVVDPDAVMQVFRDLLADGGQHAPVAHLWSLAVRTDPKDRPSLYLQTKYGGSMPEEAIAAYEAVLDEYEVVRTSIRSERVNGSAVTIAVAPDVDLAAAERVARRAAPGLGAALKVTDR